MSSEQETLINQLAPIRLPSDFANFGWMDAVSFLAIGLLLGLVCAYALSPFFRRRISPEVELQDRIKALRNQPAEARWLALCALLNSNNIALSEEEKRALYDPAAPRDFARLEAKLLAETQTRGARI